MKYIPNLISLYRILLSFILLFLEPFSILFIMLYSFSGVSDVLDGYIARKTKTMSKFGGKLDSIADIFLVACILTALFKASVITTDIIIWVIAISVIKLFTIILVFIRYRTFSILHTYGSKATGLVLFMVPYLILLLDAHATFTVVCCIASLSSIEELLIHLSSKELDVNQRGLFFK